MTRQQLRERYPAVLYATGTSTDRSLEIPGEELAGVHPASEFVAWYNGHPTIAIGAMTSAGDTRP